MHGQNKPQHSIAWHIYRRHHHHHGYSPSNDQRSDFFPPTNPILMNPNRQSTLLLIGPSSSLVLAPSSIHRFVHGFGAHSLSTSPTGLCGCCHDIEYSGGDSGIHTNKAREREREREREWNCVRGTVCRAVPTATVRDVMTTIPQPNETGPQ